MDSRAKFRFKFTVSCSWKLEGSIRLLAPLLMSGPRKRKGCPLYIRMYHAHGFPRSVRALPNE